jgi:hypothetical protein
MTTDALHNLAWPIVVLVALVIFRAPLTHLITRIKGLKFRMEGGGEFELTAAQVRGIAEDLLLEADALIRDLGPPEKKILARIVSSPRALTVEQAVPGFTRGSPELYSLRKLRNCQLIRPVGGGRFEADKYIEIKRFGQVLLKLRRDQLIPD